MEIHVAGIWALPVRGGGSISTLAQMVWGTFLEKSFQMGICLILGGSKPLPGWFGALMQWKLKFNWAFPFVNKGFKACQDSLWHLYTLKTVIWKSCSNHPGKKCPRVPVWVRGGGGQKLKVQCPNAPSMNLRKASLTLSYCISNGRDHPSNLWAKG